MSSTVHMGHGDKVLSLYPHDQYVGKDGRNEEYAVNIHLNDMCWLTPKHIAGYLGALIILKLAPTFSGASYQFNSSLANVWGGLNTRVLTYLISARAGGNLHLAGIYATGYRLVYMGACPAHLGISRWTGK